MRVPSLLYNHESTSVAQVARDSNFSPRLHAAKMNILLAEPV